MGGVVAFELGDEGRFELETEVAGDVADGAPAGLGVGAEALAFDDGDIAMSEGVEVVEGEFGGAAVVEGDVGGAGRLLVSGDGDGGDRTAMRKEGVDGNDAFDGAVEQEILGAGDHGGLVMMADEEVEVSGLEQVLFDAAEDEGSVALANLGDKDADGLGAAIAEGARGEVGAVVEALGRGEDAVLGGLWNGLCGGSGV